MGVDESQKVGEVVSKAFQYHFSTVPQFTAILETMGYECYTEDDEIVLKLVVGIVVLISTGTVVLDFIELDDL